MSYCAAEDFLEPYIKILASYNYVDKGKQQACLEDFKDALLTTSHVVKAKAVAKAAGFCAFAARLITSIGARGAFISEGVPGKGKDVHRILALASVDVLNKWKNGSKLNIDEAVEQALEDLKGNDMLITPIIFKEKADEKLNELKTEAKNMLRNLITNLPRILEKLGVQRDEYSQLKAYAELEMIDYNLHIWGVPDLIIEFPTSNNGSKAIVVEWKSAIEEDANIKGEDKYQVYIYALLEASRLGYNRAYPTCWKALKEAVLPSDDLSKTKVYPIIIRPNLPYSNHPLNPIITNKNNKNVDELKQEVNEILDKIAVASTFLTSLLVDYGALLSEEKGTKSIIDKYSEVRRNCAIVHNGRTYFALTFTPSVLKMGSPTKQSKQCNACEFSDKNTQSKWRDLKVGECRFYFGSFDKEPLDKLMWRYRYVTYHATERSLIPYRVIWRLSERLAPNIEMLADEIANKGYTARFDIGKVTIHEKKELTNMVDVTHPMLGYHEKLRFGVYDISDVYEDPLELELCRNLQPNEIIRIDDTETPMPVMPRQHKPVLIVLVEPHVSNATLGTSLFGKVLRASLIDDKEQKQAKVCLYVGLISSSLKLPFLLFKRYIKEYKYAQRALVFEANSDLTHIELNAINNLHLALSSRGKGLESNKKDLGNVELSEEEIETTSRYLENYLREALNVIGGD